MNSSETYNKKLDTKWSPPEEGILKVYVDASVFPSLTTFTIGMVTRDHQGSFIASKNLRLPAPGSVFKAEAIGVQEALSWIMARQLQNA